jgi:hypothetical protein
MAFTHVQNNGAVQDASGASISVALTGIGAGNLLVVWLKYEGISTSRTISDGTSTFTNGTETTHSNNDVHGMFSYLLSANSGNKTITCTFGASRAWSRIQIWEFSNSGQTLAFDAENGSSGTGTVPNSGNISTANADEVVLGGYGEYSTRTCIAPFINGVAADSFRTDNITMSCYKIETATFTNGAHTYPTAFSGSCDWIFSIIAFKVAGTAAPSLLGQACL